MPNENPTDARYTAPADENPHAGQGTAVVLDIGGDIGAVVITCPSELVGREIEVVPAGSRGPGGRYEHAPDETTGHDHHDHDHQHDGHDHQHDGHAHPHDGHAHPHEHHHHDDEPRSFHEGHAHPPGTPPHVGVVERPLPDGRRVPTAVFGDLVEGRYEFALRPYHGVVDLEVEVVGGEATMVGWPADTGD